MGGIRIEGLPHQVIPCMRGVDHDTKGWSPQESSRLGTLQGDMCMSPEEVYHLGRECSRLGMLPGDKCMRAMEDDHIGIACMGWYERC